MSICVTFYSKQHISSCAIERVGGCVAFTAWEPLTSVQTFIKNILFT